MKRLFVPLLTLPLLACAADTTNYPSLARRDAEKTANAAPSAANPSTSTVPASAELQQQLAGLIEQSRIAHQEFDSRKAKAEQAVSASGIIGSESWGTASIALADLESARSDAMIALADLDAIYAAARVAGNDVAAIVKARDQVIALVKEQDEVLIELRGQLRR